MEFPKRIFGTCNDKNANLHVDDPKYISALKFMLQTMEGDVNVYETHATIQGEKVDVYLSFDLLGFAYLPDESDDDNVLFVLNDDLDQEISDKGMSILDEFGRKESWHSILDRLNIPIPPIINDLW
jgi:hypothetical protein